MVETQDTVVVETGDTGVPHTADTGWTWPEGLVGEPPAVPVPPLAAFDAINALEDEKGPEDLYNQRTVLFLCQGVSDGLAERIADDLEELRPDFDTLGVRVLAVNDDPPSTNLLWRTTYGLNFDVWTDDDLELFGHYSVSQSANETRLLDEEGTLMLVYDSQLIDMDQDGHAASVLADAQLLWGGESQ